VKSLLDEPPSTHSVDDDVVRRVYRQGEHRPHPAARNSSMTAAACSWARALEVHRAHRHKLTYDHRQMGQMASGDQAPRQA